MRKILALLAGILLITGMVCGSVSAILMVYSSADIGLKTGESSEAGAYSIMVIEMTNTDGSHYDSIDKVRLDLNETGFSPAGVPASTRAGEGHISSRYAVYDLDTPTSGSSAESFTVEVPVLNPGEVGNYNLGSGFAVEVLLEGMSNWYPVDTLTVNGGSGIDIHYTVEVIPEEGIIGTTSPLYGTIKEAGHIVTGELFSVTVADAGGTIRYSGTTNNGRFSTVPSFEAGGPNPLLTNYTIVVTDSSGITGQVIIPVKYDLRLADYGEIYYRDVKSISGKLLDGAGNGMGNYKVSIEAGGTPKAYSYTGSNGVFSVQALFGDADIYNLVLEDEHGNRAVYREIHVKPLELEVTASGNLLGTVVAETLKIQASYNGTPAAGFTAKITGPSGISFTATDGDDNGIIVIPAAVYVPGTYTLDAEWEDIGNGNTPLYPDRIGRTTFTVASPKKLNYWVTPSDPFEPGSASVTIKVLDVDGHGVNPGTTTALEIKRVEYEVTGPLGSEVVFDSDEPGAVFDDGVLMTTKTLGIEVEQAGVVTVKGTVTYGDNSIKTFTETIDVEGYVLRSNKILGTVGDIVTLRAVVTDPSGIPVNNARVEWNSSVGGAFKADEDGDGTYETTLDSVIVDASDVNIQNGVYQITNRMLARADAQVTLSVKNIARTKTLAYATVRIKGEEAYTVRTNKQQLLASYEDDLIITVKDNGSGFVTGLTELTVTGAGIDKNLGDAMLHDRNGDGIYDSYKLTDLTPTTTGDIEVWVATHGGNKIGSTLIEAIAPTVEVPAIMTDSIKEKITISLKDEVDGTELVGVVRLTAVGADLVIFNDKDDDPITGTPTHDGKLLSGESFTVQPMPLEDKYTFYITGHDVPEDPAVDPELKIEVSYDSGSTFIDVGSIAIVPAQITSSLEELFIGFSNSLQITVKDAHQKPLGERTVTLTGAAGATGTTGENGRVQLNVTPSSTGTISIRVAGDGNTGIIKKIQAVADTEGPVIELLLPEVTTSATVPLLGTITDNTKVDRIFLNNSQLLFIPAGVVDLGMLDYELELVPGPNNIRMFAFDTTGNGSYVIKTITRMEQRRIRMTINNRSALVNGENQTMDQAPTMVNGRALVPLRFIAEALGGEVGWNSPYASVIIGDRTVCVSCSELVTPWATVNGREVEIDVPGSVINGRTMVPVRFIAEAFGAVVTYHNGEINIQY